MITAPCLRPQGVFKFEAEVLILHHPTTIHENYQPVVHTGTVRQTARIVSMKSALLRTGDRSKVVFQFMYVSRVTSSSHGLNTRIACVCGWGDGYSRIVCV